MNSIEKLVEKLCPDGVEFKKLADVMTLHRGISYKKTDEDEDGPVKVLRANNITLASNTLNFDDVKVVSSSVRVRPDQFVKNKDIIISVASGSKEHVGKVAFITRQNVGYSFGAFMAIIRVYEMILNPKFLFHLLTGNSFESYLQSKIKFTTINNLSAKILGAFPVPIPPLEIQQEIVNILDTYSELVAELVVELEAELEARRLQYQYYRDELLNFSGEPSAIHRSLGLDSTDKVEFKELGEIAAYPKKRIPVSDLDKDSYVGVANLLPEMQGKDMSYHLPSQGTCIGYEVDDILIGNIRPYLKKIWLADNSGGTNQDVITLRINEFYQGIITPKFFYYVLASGDFFRYQMSHSKGGKMPRGDKKAVLKYKIPVPRLEVQRQIVSILDKFEALINDLSVGLPAEIDARRQQYEYYRDKLLTFKEKV